jgi:hypothetical protein
MAHASEPESAPVGSPGRGNPEKQGDPLPKGRELRDFERLTETEQKLILACRTGEWCTLDKQLPEAGKPGLTVRASLLRFLALGGDNSTPVHELGIQLTGAHIEGELDLSYCKANVPIKLYKCVFPEEIDLQEASLKYLLIGESKISGILGDGLKVDGDLCLRGTVSNGTVRLYGANIGGDLDLADTELAVEDGEALGADRVRVAGGLFAIALKTGGTVRLAGSWISGDLTCRGASLAGDSLSLVFDGARIDGSVYLTGGFRAEGEVRLIGASMALFDCTGATLINRGGNALVAERAVFRGNVFLRQGFSSLGSINLWSTKIFGELDCDGGSFEAPSAIALDATGMSLDGTMFWQAVAKVEGGISLARAKIGSLSDDEPSWAGAAWVDWDGFTYDRISDGPTAAEIRCKLLAKQQDNPGRGEFRPQPWEQLARVLREMGHVEDARLVAMQKQRELRRQKIIGSRRPRTGWKAPWSTIERVRVWLINSATRLLHRLYGGLAGYGYRPMRTVGWMLAGWLLGALVFSLGETRGVFGPTAPLLQTSAGFETCGAPGEPGTQHWTRCAALPPEHTQFNAVMYSLDVILPLVDLRQEGDWAPITHARHGGRLWEGEIVRALMWIQILFGWITSLLLASAAGRLVQKD